MRTITTNVYKFEELSEQAKETAIENYRNSNDPDTDHLYDEAHDTVKAFHELFPTKFNAWGGLFDFTITAHENIESLTGLRLRTWIINNFWDDLFTPTFKNGIGYNKVINHPRIKTNYYDMDKGARVSSSNFYYSAIQRDNGCTLTGVCYDNSLLDPMYQFLEWNDKPDYYKDLDFETLIGDCFSELEHDLEREVESINEDDFIQETIEANEYEFDEDGNMI